ncbi:MAG: hypothetical protein ACE5GD_03035 [Candidatus Geothermarchaeales archaeon]
MFRAIISLGVAVIIIGVALVLIGVAARYAPPLEKLPPILIYVYRRGDFYLVTSPILILLGVLLLLILLLSRFPRF